MELTSHNITPVSVPRSWSESSAGRDITLHQISPYIGKLKSTIARELISRFSNPGDVVLDPFAGSGTIPLEALLLGRRSVAADTNPYAQVLCLAKMTAPPTIEEALREVRELLADAALVDVKHLNNAPEWVRAFFHPRTLNEARQFAFVALASKNWFLLGCLLGILHHQRPGFLSYPSSHLVPYLRDRKFPRQAFPELYTYRPLAPRLIAKVNRAYRRIQLFKYRGRFELRDIESLRFPRRVDAIVTSPPYMNALDYGRDNRLRLWFITGKSAEDTPATRQRDAFLRAIVALAKKSNRHLQRGGHCVLIVGERVARKNKLHPADVVRAAFAENAKSLRLIKVLSDLIPDIRRSRRDCTSTKSEQILVFRKG